jgi:hypothetical protein
MKVTKAAFPNVTLTPETAAVYLSEWSLIVAEIGQDGFELALSAALRGSRFFPTIAEIREHAGINIAPEKRLKIQAEQAWQWVQTFIRKWDRVPGEGECIGWDPQIGKPLFKTPKPIPERINYAVRAVGGIRAIAGVDDHSLPFMRKEFAEAFENAQFAATFGLELPPHEVLKQLGAGLPTVKHLPEATPKRVREMPRELTDEELDARRSELERQAQRLMKSTAGECPGV